MSQTGNKFYALFFAKIASGWHIRYNEVSGRVIKKLEIYIALLQSYSPRTSRHFVTRALTVPK